MTRKVLWGLALVVLAGAVDVSHRVSVEGAAPEGSQEPGWRSTDVSGGHVLAVAADAAQYPGCGRHVLGCCRST